MEMIDRYVYAVTNKLPLKQRADIEKEVRGLIEDLLEEHAPDGPINQQHVEAVLNELGNPYELAAKYKGSKRYLISPEVFDMYLTVLKVVTISIWVGLSAVFGLESLLEPMSVGEHFTSYIVSMFTVAMQGFAWVTIIFAVLEYADVKLAKIGKEAKGEWKPTQLQPIPIPKTHIKPSEAIFGVICAVFYMVLFIFSRDLLGIHQIPDGGQPRTFVPFINEEVFKDFLPFVYIWLGIGLLRECLKLVTRRWSMKLACCFVLFNIFSFLLVIVIFSDQSVWNPEFMNELIQSGLLEANSEIFETVNNVWSGVTQGIVYFSLIILLIDSTYVLYKGYQASKASQEVKGSLFL